MAMVCSKFASEKDGAAKHGRALFYGHRSTLDPNFANGILTWRYSE